MANFPKNYIGPIENTVDALTPGLTAQSIGPPVRPGHYVAAASIGPPVKPKVPAPPPPPPLLSEYEPLIEFVDLYCGLTKPRRRNPPWPNPGPLLSLRAPAAVRGAGLLIAAAFLRRNAAREWISSDPVRRLIEDAAARLSARGQELLG